MFRIWIVHIVHVYYMYLRIYVDLHHPLFVVCSAKCFKDFARSLIQQPFKMIVTKMANDGLYLADYYVICWKEVERPTRATPGSLLWECRVQDHHLLYMSLVTYCFSVDLSHRGICVESAPFDETLNLSWMHNRLAYEIVWVHHFKVAVVRFACW